MIQGTGSTVHQMGMDLKKSFARFIIGGNCKIYDRVSRSRQEKRSNAGGINRVE